MTRDNHRGAIDFCWPLLAALLLCIGFAVPGATAQRPAFEYSEPGPGAVRAEPRLAPARLQEPGAPEEQGIQPFFAPLSSTRREAPRHGYEATGPPTHG